MSTGPNADAVQRGIDAYNAGDVDGLLAMGQPDMEWVVAPEHPAATTHRGMDAIREYHEDWQSMVDELRLEVRSVREAGDSVVTVCHLSGKGAESGADVAVEIAFLVTFREGKAISVEEFLDPEEALRALASAPDG